MTLALISSNDILLKNMNYYISKNVTKVICGNRTLIDKEVIKYVKNNHIPFEILNCEETVEAFESHNNYDTLDLNFADEFILFWNGKDKYIEEFANLCKLKSKKYLMVQVINATRLSFTSWRFLTLRKY